MKRQIYFQNFDGLRFFAALLVIFAHYVTVFSSRDNTMGKWTKIILTLDGAGADTGVNFFFVLSGFLITYLIFTESDTVDTPYIKKFYIRRVLRIWPLYFLTVVVGLLAFPLLDKIPHYVEAADWRMYALFLPNIDQIYFWNNPPHPNLLLGVHWSVGVEEQFYLIWPWLLLFFRRNFLLVTFLVWISAFTYQYIAHLPTHTFSSFQDLSIGGILAYFCINKKELIESYLLKLNKSVIIFSYLAGILVIVSRYQLTKQFPSYQEWYRPVHDLIFCWIILDQGFNPKSVFQCSRLPWVSYLGKVSYGLYLLHPLAILLVQVFLLEHLNNLLILPAIFFLTLLLSSLSYEYFESYFLRLKIRYS
jgi:peptidoglycan/LPS O-acetylase OafA/YrhL